MSKEKERVDVGLKYKKPFKILSLDGGGVRAIIATTILCRLQEKFPNLMAEVDMIAGTSAGAIVASALSVGYTPEYVKNIWLTNAPKIFLEGWRRKVSTVDNCFGASYVADPLKEMLEKTLGDKTMGDIKKHLLVPSFNLDQDLLRMDHPDCRRWGPEFFQNLDNSYRHVKLSDIVLRTTAAPTYFPIYQGFVDGGTFANNPAMAAITSAVQHGVNLEDIVVFSISTGNNPKYISSNTYKDGNWGLVEWGPHLIDLLLDSNTESINYNCKCLLQDRYHRIDPILPNPIGLDDASELQQLDELAKEYDLDQTSEWLLKRWITDPNPKVNETSAMPLEEVNMKSSWRCVIQ